MRAKERYDRGEVKKETLKQFEFHQTDLNRDESPAKTVIDEFNEVKSFPTAGRSNGFWGGFMVLALLGFTASFALFLKGKEWMFALMPESYKETGIWGILSDAIGIVFFLFYVVALYLVGWG
jgi:hypothetical protein